MTAPTASVDERATIGDRLRSTTFRSLRHRNARLYFLGLVVSNSGTWLQATATVWLALRLNDSGVALGTVVACQFLPSLLIGPWAGVYADRNDRRRIVVMAQCLIAAEAVLLGLLDLSGAIGFASLCGLCLVLGLANAFDQPARQSLISDLVEPDEAQNAMALNLAIMTGSRIVGPALAGVLIATVGTGWCFLLSALTTLAVIGAVQAMDATQLHRRELVARAKGQIREGLAFVRRDRRLVVVFWMLIVICTFTFNFQVSVPILVEDVFGGGAAAFGLLLAVQSVGSVTGSLLTATRRRVDVRYCIGAAALAGVFMCGMALAPGLAVACVFAPLMGGFGSAFTAASGGVIVRRTSDSVRGRVLALQTTVFFGSTPIGSPIIGWVADHLGPRWGLGIGAIAAIFAAGVGAVLFAGGDRRPVEEPVP